MKNSSTIKQALFSLYIVMVMFTSTSAQAEEEVITAFMKECTHNGASEVFCQCSLQKFSDMLRKTAKEELQKRQENFDKHRKELLEDANLDQTKIDAICHLHNLSVDYTRKATALRGIEQAELAKEYKKQKRKAQREKMNLLNSYDLDPHTSANKLLGGAYCKEKLILDESKKDLEQDDGTIYPELKRLLKYNMFHHSGVVMSLGSRTKCPR